jgi:chorismate mutase
MDTKEKINHLRQTIDKYDDQMLDILVKRFEVSLEIGKIKSSENLKVGDPNREQHIIDRLSERLSGKLDSEDIAAIFGPIYRISKKIQRK